MKSPVRFGSVRFRSGPVPVPAVRFYRFFDCFFVFFEIFYVFRPFLHGKNDPQILIILFLFYVDFFFSTYIFFNLDISSFFTSGNRPGDPQIIPGTSPDDPQMIPRTSPDDLLRPL